MRIGILATGLVMVASACTSNNTAETSTSAQATNTTVAISCGPGTKLDGRQCVVDATTTPTEPPTTPPATEPATTEPATTEPPATEPPATIPSLTAPASPVCAASYHLDENNHCVPGSTNSSVPAETVPTEEIAAALTAPLTAWMLKPSGPGFDAVAAAAQALIDDPRPLPFIPSTFGAQVDSAIAIRSLTAYPGNDPDVYEAADSLRSMIPSLPFILEDGNYTVGTDVPPGEYRTVGPVDSCYWETLNSAGDINRNNFVNAAPQVLMTVRSSDYAMNSERCGPWVKIG